jgi:DNA-binding MarR family transcriptional regulator
VDAQDHRLDALTSLPARQTGPVTSAEQPGRPPTSTSVLLLTLARRIEAELTAELAPLGLTVARLGLLGHVSAVPGASFSELARMSGISVQSVHAAVKGLVSAGLVRDDTARAGAASRIAVTEEGSRLLRAAMDAVAAVDGRLFGPAADPFPRRVGAAAAEAFRADLQDS